MIRAEYAMAATCALLGLGAVCDLTGGVQVRTANGDITGTINATSPDVRQFLGIPYAEPPTSNLLFQPPVKYRPRGWINATAFAPSCMQPLAAGNATDIYSLLLPKLHLGSDLQSEDCLYLNVYAPLIPTEDRLPVFVWIHGGGFTNNGANVPYQIPDQWVQRTQGHVVVTINYRLNIFGFPNAADQPLNAGLLDQRLAVEWVRDNIEAFGGDPDRIVLWGQSAGAWSANYYGYAYPEDPIVKGLIVDSGGSTVMTSDDLHTNFSAVAQAVGCGDLGSHDELTCMQSMEGAILQKQYSSMTTVSFGPVVDGVTVFSNNTERAVRGLVAKLPAIVGFNSREGSGFVSFSAGSVPPDAEIDAAGQMIVYPTLAEVQNRVLGGLSTYHYFYTGNFSNITPLPWIGAIHSGELPLLFGTHFEYNGGDSTELEWLTSYAMEGLWLSFASNVSASPTYEDFTWPSYENGNDSTVIFARDNIPVQVGSATVGTDCS